MSRIIKKVKISGNGVQVDFVDDGDGVTNTFSMCTTDAPSPDLINAMNRLAEHACKICGLPQSYADGCNVTGLSLSYTNDIMGAVITVQKPLKNSDAPFVFNTPHLPSEPYSGRLDYSKCLSSECVEAIEDVQREALEHIKGKRAQLNLGL